MIYMKKITIIGIIAWVILWFSISGAYFTILEFFQSYTTQTTHGFVISSTDYSPMFWILFLFFGALLGAILLRQYLEK